ncbi:MAG: ABC transporter permease subunit [Chloroflexota bacterium]
MSNTPKATATTRAGATSTVAGAAATDRPLRAVMPAPSPVSSVVVWELRRIASSRSMWLLVGVAFLFFALITLLLKDSQSLVYGEPQSVDGAMARPDTIRVSGTSAWGMSITIPKYLLLVFGMLLPFVAVDGVARDFKRRTHEIVMAARIPTWAYVVGRYMAVLVIALGLALVMLAAVLLAGFALHLWAGYPPPSTSAILALWAVAVLPAAVLLSGLGFALGTLLTRHANSIKAVLLVGWVLCQFTGALWEDSAGQGAYALVDPAAVMMSQSIQGPYAVAFFRSVGEVIEAGKPMSKQQAEGIVRDVEQKTPDLWPWILPRSVYAATGLAAVAFAAARFRRFKGA